MFRFKLIFFVCISLASLIFVLFNSSSTNNPFLTIRNDIIDLTSHLQKLLTITSVPIHPFKYMTNFGYLSQMKHTAIIATRNVPSILSVESPYINDKGMILL